jgi:hypothetical protein
VSDVYTGALRIAQALEGAGVPYAIGGAIAYAYHANPRATNDIDLNLFVPMGACRDALSVLATVIDLDIDRAVAEAAQGGDARGSFEGVRVDVFLDSIDLHQRARERRVKVELSGVPVWILSAEDLAVLKLLFDRPKDHVDIERLLAVQGERFDVAYARDQLVRAMGEDDHRVEALDTYVRRWVPSSSR